MEKRIFEFSRLQLWDYITIGLYLVLTIYIHLTFTKDTFPSYANLLIFGYIFGTMMFNYLFNYKSLRNMTVFSIWILFGLYHFWLFKHLENVKEMYYDSRHIAYGLKYSIVVLVIQQIFRFSYIKLTNMELVAPVKGGGTDIFDNRYPNILDFAFFALYVFIIVGIGFI